jgi:hypothetical protein
MHRAQTGYNMLHLPKPDLMVKNDRIHLKLQTNSDSQILVSEMMVLAGEIAAKYSVEHSIPIPFRIQVSRYQIWLLTSIVFTAGKSQSHRRTKSICCSLEHYSVFKQSKSIPTTKTALWYGVRKLLTGYLSHKKIY